MYRLSRLLLILAVLLGLLSVALLTIRFFPLSLIGLAVLGVYAKKKGYFLTAHGTARWADSNDLRQAGMLGAEEGIILGRLPQQVRRTPPIKQIPLLFKRRLDAKTVYERIFRNKSGPELVRLVNSVHTAVFAPTGAGKGVSIVIPTLLDCKDSAFVLDPKGENHKRTAEHRRAMGQRIVLLDPFRMIGKGEGCNPLDNIDADSPGCIGDCKALANALVIRMKQEPDPHWNDMGEEWILACIVFVVCYCPPQIRNLVSVRELLTDPAGRHDMLGMLRTSDKHGGELSTMGNRLSGLQGNELSSTLSNACRHLSFLGDPQVAEFVKGQGVPDMKKEKVTAYLVIPPHKVKSSAALLRMVVGSTLQALYRGGLEEGSRARLIIDEAASLGHLDAIDSAIREGRGYGVRLLLIYQSPAQLLECYPDGQDKTVMGNVDQVFFRVSDLDTADYVSKRLGTETIAVESWGETQGRNTGTTTGSTFSQSAGGNSGRSQNVAQQARELLKPDEVPRLDARTAITFVPGMPPIMTTLTRYYEERPQSRPGTLSRAWAASCALFWSVAVFGLCATCAVALTLVIAESSRRAPGQSQVRKAR